MKSHNIQRAVMRRIYYAYAISIGTHAMFWQGMFLGAAALLLADWLHVAKIVSNFLSVPVGHVPGYVVQAFVGAIGHGELLTALTIVLAAGVAVSAGYHLAQAVFGRFLAVRA